MKKIILLSFMFVYSYPVIAATGFLKGEEVSGLNKICIYSSARGDFTITQRAASVCRVSADDGRGSGGSLGGSSSGGNVGGGTTGFLQNERTSGLNKICVYSGARGRFTITQRAASVCRPSARQP
jgi:hypothetical protein|tara:strand:+ start:83 stop:457 length:375 start_codon:yes stop_codon:yes gene_type:complete